jgi:nucleotide-binding universal stress UspA family protein
MKVLVATDGGDEARAAVEWLVHVPLPASATFRFVSVATLPPSPLDIPPVRDYYRSLLEAAHRAARAGQAAVSQRWADADVHVVEGDPRERILEEAEAWNADLLVLGARGMGAVQSFLLGGVSAGVVQHAHCPVLVVKGRRVALRHVLIAVDGSADAMAAARFVGGWPLDGKVDITLLGVVERGEIPLSADEGSTLSVREAVARFAERHREELQAILDRLRAELGAVAHEITASVVSGHPAEEILRAAADPRVDLVVVGARGLGRFGRLLLGSVSQRVLQHAGGPVLVVKPR